MRTRSLYREKEREGRGRGRGKGEEGVKGEQRVMEVAGA